MGTLEFPIGATERRQGGQQQGCKPGPPHLKSVYLHCAIMIDSTTNHHGKCLLASGGPFCESNKRFMPQVFFPTWADPAKKDDLFRRRVSIETGRDAQRHALAGLGQPNGAQLEQHEQT